MNLARYSALLGILAVLSACVSPGATVPPVPLSTEVPTDLPTGTPPPPQFRIIGYITEAVIPAMVQYDKLTHLNYSFLIPNDDGTFKPMANPWKLTEIVTQAHAAGGKVLISIGGWGWDNEFEAVGADPQLRAVFVSELMKFINEYQLDGADMDWEFPDQGQSSLNYLALMRELRTALGSKLLTAAVVSQGDYNGLGIPVEIFEVVDFLNIMAYDDGSRPNHSSYELAVAALDYWLGRGLPPEKAVLGVPFYSHPSGTIYRKIVEADPAAAQLDEFNYFGVMINYNGIPTIIRKTQLAMERASGIMFWTLESDSYDPGLSLLNAIYTTAHGGDQ